MAADLGSETPIPDVVTSDELCDGIDNDLDGEIDEGTMGTTPLWVDADFDGWGVGDPQFPCVSDESGWAHRPADCDDTNPLRAPGASEICDTKSDNDCDGFSGCDDYDCRNDVACAAVCEDECYINGDVTTQRADSLTSIDGRFTHPLVIRGFRGRSISVVSVAQTRWSWPGEMDSFGQPGSIESFGPFTLSNADPVEGQAVVGHTNTLVGSVRARVYSELIDDWLDVPECEADCFAIADAATGALFVLHRDRLCRHLDDSEACVQTDGEALLAVHDGLSYVGNFHGDALLIGLNGGVFAASPSDTGLELVDLGLENPFVGGPFVASCSFGAPHDSLVSLGLDGVLIHPLPVDPETDPASILGEVGGLFCSDVDGDGLDELLIRTSSETGYVLAVYAYNDATFTLQARVLGIDVWAVPVVADLNEDGDLDLLLPTNDGQLAFFDGPLLEPK